MAKTTKMDGKPDRQTFAALVSSERAVELRAKVQECIARLGVDEYGRKPTMGGLVAAAIDRLHKEICGEADA